MAKDIPDRKHAEEGITHIKRMETTFRGSEERFKDFAEAASDWFWEMDENLHFTYHSLRYFEITGFRPEDKIGTTRTRYVDPENLERDADTWAAHMEGLEARRPFKNFEFAFKANDGATINARISGTPVFDAEGVFLGCRGTGTDITESKQIQDALKESEERFRSVIDNSPSFITLKDADGRFQLVNRKHAEMFGLEPPDIVGKSSSDLFSKKLAEEATAHERKVLETKSAITEERQISIKQETRDFLITKFPVLDGSGDVVRIGTIGTDITDHKRMNEALQESEERFRAVVNSSPAAITLKDLDGVFLLVNRTFANWMNADPSVLMGKNIRDLYPPDEVDEIVSHEQQVIETGEEIIKEEVRSFLDGQTRTITTHRYPIHSTAGEIIAISTNIIDISEYKRAEDALHAALADARQANQAKSKFLAAMSHEFRTPLNAILGFTDILSHQYFGPPGAGKYKEYAADIHASGEHLLELVNDILDLSAIEAGKQSLIKEMLSTEEIVGECERIIEEKARSLGIDLIIKVSKDLPPLYADRRASKQILLNLLSNAVKFTPQGGKITISAKANKRNMTLMIADTGKGIPDENLPNLTDPFIRANTDPYLAEQGWGLGLSITKSLIDLHDGTIDIKSKVGKGTTVTVTFPNEAP